MIFLRLRATLGVNLLSGGDAHHNRARPPFHAVRTCLSMGART
jgi:hypothetical protein